MLISRRRMRTVLGLLVVIAVGTVRATPAVGQTSQPEPERLPPPEQMIDEALQKVDAGEFQAADTLLRRARVLKPTMHKIKLVEGLLALHANKDPIGALGRLQEYNKTEDGRNDYRGYLAVGRLYKDSSMFRLAFPPLETAKTLAPIEENGKQVAAEIAVELAIVYNALPRKEKALEAAKEAQKLAPNDAKVQLSLGQIAFSTEDYATAAKSADRAIEILVAALRSDPLKRESYGLLNSCYQLKRDLAQGDLNRTPEAAAPYHRLAVAARNAAEVNRLTLLLEARENAVQALAKEPENTEYLLFAARIEAELGAVDEAQGKVERVLKSHPEQKQAIELQERLKTGVSGFTPF